MVVETAPTAALIMADTDFLFQIKVIALNTPAQFGDVHQLRERDILRQSGEPILRWFRLAFRPFD